MSGPDVVHVPERSRFEVVEPAGTAVLVYALGEREIALQHTVVPPPLGGRGVGSALIRAALTWAVQEGLAVVPQCPFVQAFLAQHPDEFAVQLRPA